MILLTALLIALLFGTGVFLILQRRFIHILFGFGLLTHAANLFILSMSGYAEHQTAPIVSALSKHSVDPLPQALILTAIVIGFGVSAYLVVLMYRLSVDNNTDDAKEMFDQDIENYLSQRKDPQK